MSNDYSPEVMRKRFWELTDKKDELNKELAPLRKERDALRDKMRKPMGELKAAQVAVVNVERPRMGKIDMEMAVLARALGNKIGPREDGVHG